jgi:predicted ATPase
MRLDKLTIGSAKASINGLDNHRFKNLKDVTIDFDQDHWVTVVIGWNGTGKSNVLEALAIIFRDLIAKKRTPTFAFQLAYCMSKGDDTLHIHIDADPDREKEAFVIHVATEAEARGEAQPISTIEGVPKTSALRGKVLKLSKFLADDELHLPRYVFSYYSGESQRMREVFRPYLESYDGKLRNGDDPGLKRLFYAMPVHSQFVLLAFLIQQSDVVRAFLHDHLGLDPDEGVESVLFVLRQPPWNSKAPDGDPRFWNARGVVRDFVSRLYDIAVAPVEISRRVATSLWNKETLQFKYLYVKDIAALRRLVGDQTPAEFFRDLESTYVSELIEEVRIRVRLKKSDSSVTFRELSEGEQQLLTVLGLLRFTSEDESLFLLDEPDTHLNPRWCVEYISYLKQFISTGTKQDETSHILLTTHNPLAIAELDREQVQILRMAKQDVQRQVVACYPEMAPRGMGYAAIVTSDMFGIASSLDKSTQLLLEEQRAFAAKERLSTAEQRELDRINSELDRLGFRFFHPDDEYSRYLRLRNDLLLEQFQTENPAELAKQVIQMPRDEREKLAKRLIAELLSEQSNSRDGAMR